MLIIRLLWVVNIVIILITWGLVWGVFNDQVGLDIVRAIGRKTGVAALVMLGIVLTPGIVRRLQLGLVLNRWIMPFRRQLGIMTYLLVVMHSVFTYYLPIWMSGRLIILNPPVFVTFGFLSFLLLTPLFLTSNDWSVRTLKRWWGKIHKLVYVVTFLVLMHLTLQQKSWSVLAGLIVLMEVVSYGVFYWRRKSDSRSIV